MRTATTTEKYPRPWTAEPTWFDGDGNEVTLVFASMANPAKVFDVERKLTPLAEYIVRTVNAMPEEEFQALMRDIDA
jgi:hypothetical protein